MGDLPDHLREKIRQQYPDDPEVLRAAGFLPKPRAKFGNVKCTDETGQAFDSKHERKVHHAEAANAVAVIPQVSMPLGPAEGGKVQRIRVDMLVIREVHEDGTFTGEFVDAKGMATDTAKTKRNWFQQLYGGVKIRWT